VLLKVVSMSWNSRKKIV